MPQDGAIDELDDSRVMFGYVRCIMPDGRPKFVAIIWAGPAAAEQHKGKIQGYQRQIEDFLRPSIQFLTAGSREHYCDVVGVERDVAFALFWETLP